MKNKIFTIIFITVILFSTVPVSAGEIPVNPERGIGGSIVGGSGGGSTVVYHPTSGLENVKIKTVCDKINYGCIEVSDEKGNSMKFFSFGLLGYSDHKIEQTDDLLITRDLTGRWIIKGDLKIIDNFPYEGEYSVINLKNLIMYEVISSCMVRAKNAVGESYIKDIYINVEMGEERLTVRLCNSLFYVYVKSVSKNCLSQD